MFTVAELFDFFLSACKANYWPEGCIAPDEAVKNIWPCWLKSGKIWIAFSKLRLEYHLQEPCWKTKPATKVRVSFDLKIQHSSIQMTCIFPCLGNPYARQKQTQISTAYLHLWALPKKRIWNTQNAWSTNSAVNVLHPCVFQIASRVSTLQNRCS